MLCHVSRVQSTTAWQALDTRPTLKSCVIKERKGMDCSRYFQEHTFTT